MNLNFFLARIGDFLAEEFLHNHSFNRIKHMVSGKHTSTYDLHKTINHEMKER